MSTQPNVTLDAERWKLHLKAVGDSQDKGAYQALYLHFAPKVKSFYIQQGLGNKSEELTHEVFLKIWQKAKTYNPSKAQVSTWIFTIVRNLRIDYLRKKKIEEVSDEEQSHIGEDGKLDEKIEAAKSKSRLLSVFKLLNNEQRNVLQKVYFEDKSHQIAAEELEMTPGTVKSRIRSAMKVLRSHMGGEEL
ncbi:MAG: sigma-70 family RNA polymerase sigma factor [Kangiellaceae bacterium]|nr:sigma-70 family RNA polymerase sigma factor [Kangiellaceae bacterium]MCW8998687.1 sigma-70 family RNA polymerase sigma factor [Kangiellaceae bacterium]